MKTMTKKKLKKPNINKPAFKIYPEMARRAVDGVCTFCGAKIEGFTDELSEKEYSISGMCQECQDYIYEQEE